MANKPTQPLFPLGLETAESSVLKGFTNSGTIEHSADAIMTLPEGDVSQGIPSSVRYNHTTDAFEGYYDNGGWLPLGGGGIRWEALGHAPSSNLVEGRGYLVDNKSGSSAVVLPVPTKIGDSVSICDAYGKFSVYPLTISGNGHPVYGAVDDMVVSTDNMAATFTWSGDERGWVITAGVGLGQGRVYNRTIYTQVLAAETAKVTLSEAPSIVDVYADGKRLLETKYSLSGNDVEFTPPLASGVELQIIEYIPIQLGVGGGGGTGSTTITWVYNGGAATGGETTIVLDVVVDSVAEIYIRGVRQQLNLGFTYDKLSKTITLAEELEQGDEVIAILNGSPTVYNQIDRTPQEVARSTNLKDDQVILSSSTAVVLDGKQVIYDVSAQKYWGLPTGIPTGATIVGVVGSALTYKVGSTNTTVQLGEISDTANIREQWRRSLSESGLTLVDGSFEEGATANSKTDAVWYIAGGQCYTWDGAFQPGGKVVALGSTPAPGGAGAWLSVEGRALRNDLAQATGAAMAGYGESTVSEALDTLTKRHTLYFSEFGTLVDLQAHITSKNLKNVDIIFDDVLNLGPGSGGLSTLVKLSDMDYLGIKNLVIRDTLLYSGAFDVTRVFDLTNISTLHFEVDAASTLEYVGDDKRGLTPLRLTGCDNFTFLGKTVKCYQGYEIHNVKTVQARSVNNDTRYPHALSSVGTVDIYTKNNGCRRDFFLQDNCSGGQITVDAIDTQQGTPVKMYFFNGNMNNQISNLTINYKYRSTGRYDATLPSRNPPIWLEWGWDSTITETLIAGVMRNITVNYDVVGGAWGSVIGTRKLIDETTGDTTGRGYIFSNIAIKGRIELGGMPGGNAVFFNFRDADNWKSGDSINGFTCKDLVVIKQNGGNVAVNVSQLTGAVTNYGGITFDNVACQTAVTDASDFSKVKFRECVFSDFASLGATPDASKSASGSMLFLKNTGDSRNFKLGTISTYRNVSLWTIDIVANSPFSGVTSAWHGRIQGTLPAGTTPAALTMEGSVQSSFTKGTPATPTVTADVSGNVYLNFAGWDTLEANVSVRVSMQYDEFSGGGNKTVRGMLSKANGGFSLNLT